MNLEAFDPNNYKTRKDIPREHRSEFKTIPKAEGGGFVGKTAFEFGKERAEEEAAKLLSPEGKAPTTQEESEEMLAKNIDIINPVDVITPKPKSEDEFKKKTEEPPVSVTPEPRLAESKELLSDELKKSFKEIRLEANNVPAEFKELENIIRQKKQPKEYLGGKSPDDIRGDMVKLDNEFNRVNTLFARLNREMGGSNNDEVRLFKNRMYRFLGENINLKDLFGKELAKREKAKPVSEPIPSTPPEPPVEIPVELPVETEVKVEKPEEFGRNRFLNMSEKRLRKFKFNDREAMSRLEDLGRRGYNLRDKFYMRTIGRLSQTYSNWRFGAYEQKSRINNEELSGYRQEISELNKELENTNRSIEQLRAENRANVDGVYSVDYMDLIDERNALKKDIADLERKMGPIQNKLDRNNRLKTTFYDRTVTIQKEISVRVDERLNPVKDRISGLEMERRNIEEAIDARAEKILEQENRAHDLEERARKTKGWSNRISLQRKLYKINREIANSHRTVINLRRQIDKINKPLNKLAREKGYWEEMSKSFIQTQELVIIPTGEIKSFRPDRKINGSEGVNIGSSGPSEENPKAENIEGERNEDEDKEMQVENTVAKMKRLIGGMTLGGRLIRGAFYQNPVFGRREYNAIFEDITDALLDNSLDNKKKKEEVNKYLRRMFSRKVSTFKEQERITSFVNLNLDDLL